MDATLGRGSQALAKWIEDLRLRMPRGGGAEPHSALQTTAKEADGPLFRQSGANGCWRASLRPHGLLSSMTATLLWLNGARAR
jgi:hypothetical protein